MRDNYVGDVGDFFKYGLLRHLCGETAHDDLPKLRLGVTWYLYPDPCKPEDGLHLDYLTGKKRDAFRACDTDLHDKLSKLIEQNNRTVQAIRRRNILPKDTLFHERPLSLSSLPKGSANAIRQRLEHRAAWLDNAFSVTREAQLVFFDPDNGLEVKSTPKHSDRGPKFTFYDELLPFWQRGQSLVIYQHKNMHESAEQQIMTRIRELRERLQDILLVEAVYFPSYGGRIFFIVARGEYMETLGQRLFKFQQTWNFFVKAQRAFDLSGHKDRKGGISDDQPFYEG